jgi:hypothetical protein
MPALVNSTSTGSGTEYNFDQPLTTFGLQVTHAGSTAIPAKIILEGSLNGSNWDTLTGGVWSSTAGQITGDIVFIANMPIMNIRATMTLYNANSSKVSAWISGGV